MRRVIRWYTEDRLKLEEIAQRLGCGKETVRGRLKDAGIPRRSHVDYRASRRKELPIDVIVGMYVKGHRSCGEIAKVLRCEPELVRQRLIEAGVRRRSPSGYSRATCGVWLTKDLLVQEYVVNHKSTLTIAAEYGTNHRTVLNYLQRYGIEKRKTKERRLGAVLTRERLEQLYVRDQKSIVETAHALSADSEAVWDYLKLYGIPRRDGREKHFSQRALEAAAQRTRDRWQNDGVFREKIVRVLAEHNADPAFQKKRMEACYRTPNKAEVRLQGILERHGFPFKFVGNGSVIIHGFSPDFIDANGGKRIIELFGDYWHRRPGIPSYGTEEGRKAVFAKYGFRTLIVWEHELRAEAVLVQRIQGWMER